MNAGSILDLCCCFSDLYLALRNHLTGLGFSQIRYTSLCNWLQLFPKEFFFAIDTLYLITNGNEFVIQSEHAIPWIIVTEIVVRKVK